MAVPASIGWLPRHRALREPAAERFAFQQRERIRQRFHRDLALQARVVPGPDAPETNYFRDAGR
jgi:hypothetical protein